MNTPFVPVAIDLFPLTLFNVNFSNRSKDMKNSKAKKRNKKGSNKKDLSVALTAAIVWKQFRTVLVSS